MKNIKNLFIVLILFICVSSLKSQALLTETTYGNTRDTITVSNTTIQSNVFTNNRYDNVYLCYYSSVTSLWYTYLIDFDMKYINSVRVNYHGAIDSLAQVEVYVGSTWFPVTVQTAKGVASSTTVSLTGGGTRWISFIGVKN